MKELVECPICLREDSKHMFVDAGKLTTRITTACNRCKDERTYEGAVAEVVK